MHCNYPERLPGERAAARAGGVHTRPSESSMNPGPAGARIMINRDTTFLISDELGNVPPAASLASTTKTIASSVRTSFGSMKPA